MSHFNTPQATTRIIIEGADSIGKDTFIEHFKAYITGEGIGDTKGIEVFGGANFSRAENDTAVLKRTGKPVSSYPWKIQEKLWDETKRYPKRFHFKWLSQMQPHWRDIFSSIAYHSKDSSPEAKNFLERLDAGVPFTPEEIATEYLQIHYDLERLCRSAEQTFDIVMMNRSLVSFYAIQIHALGMKEFEVNWGKLWRWAHQKSGILVHLTSSEDVVRERLRTRQETDDRGELENTLMDRFHAIEAGINIVKAAPEWSGVFTIDTNKPVQEFKTDFENILKHLQVLRIRAESSL